MSESLSDRRLGALLIERGLITEKELEIALAAQVSSPLPLGSLLSASTELSVDDLGATLGEQLNVPYTNLSELSESNPLAGVAPMESLRDWECIPLEVEGQTLRVGLTNPSNRQLQLEIKRATGYRHLKVCVVPHQAFAAWLEKEHQQAPTMVGLVESARDIDIGFPHSGAAGPNELVSAILNYCIQQFLVRYAGSLHFEPDATRSSCRIRIHGRRETVCRIPSRLHMPLVLALKTYVGGASDLRGEIPIKFNNKSLKLRVEMINTTFGCSVTIRRHELKQRRLAELGFTGQQITGLEAAMASDGGLILVAGPEGSGASTTLNALACQSSRPDQLTMAISASSESVASGVLTIPLMPDQSISNVVHAAIRHNPDVLLIDSDRPSMDLWPAFTATMSGTRVLMKVPAVRALDAITQTPCPSYTMASVLRAVISQRLLRQVCTSCAESVDLDDSVLKELGIESQYVDSATFKEGRGCSTCGGSGFSGVIVVRETLIVPDEMRPLIRDAVDTDQLLDMARDHGFTTLWEEAIWAVIKGLTTVPEIRAALMS